MDACTHSLSVEGMMTVLIKDLPAELQSGWPLLIPLQIKPWEKTTP